MRLRIDRASVAMGDDVDSHELVLEVEASRPLGPFLQDVLRRGYLPTVFGGSATWVVRAGGRRGRRVAVLAQEWEEPALLVEPSVVVARLADSFYFEYLGQQDPDAVLADLRRPRVR